MRLVTARTGGQSITVTQLGFGCARLHDGIEMRHAFSMLERAYELGIRHFDTAPSYGHGQSESILGVVFSGVTDITVTTKIGIPRPTHGPSFASVVRRLMLRRVLSHAPNLKKRLRGQAQVASSQTAMQPKRVLARDIVLRALDDSQRQLRRDRIDFYCIHEPDQFVIDDDLLAVFETLKASGRIFAHGLAWGREAPTAQPGWDIIQALYGPQYPTDGRLRFFHGAMRFIELDAAARLAVAMRDHANAIFIVSASARHQLTDIARRVMEYQN